MSPGDNAMREMTPNDHVRSMRASLQMLDLQVGRSLLSAEGIADLKREVDNMRLRIWAIMAAESEQQGAGSLERFRLRRAIEITSKITEELERGEMSPEHSELDALDELGPRLTHALRSARGRS
jgi:hypothetical protein